MKDQFGPAGTILMGIWDWETQETETHHKSNQLLEECIGQCLSTNKAMFGFVERIKKENWGWDSPQKNNNLSGIVAVGGGWENYSVFLDNAGNIYTCGNNQFGQLGLGDTEDRHTPQKVNNIPPMSCISCCNTAWGYLQIVDEAGRVWSCGRNDFGQLGLGHTKETLTFQKRVELKSHQTPNNPTNVENAPGGKSRQQRRHNRIASEKTKILNQILFFFMVAAFIGGFAVLLSKIESGS